MGEKELFQFRGAQKNTHELDKPLLYLQRGIHHVSTSEEQGRVR
jgi:hypothetical protein